MRKIRIILVGAVLVCTGALNAQNPFQNVIQAPYTISGKSQSFNVQGATHNFDPGGTIDSRKIDTTVASYCYNAVGQSAMTYLGPTLIFEKGDSIHFTITNNLPGGHRTTVHWHGLNIPASEDGGPHQVIQNFAIDTGTGRWRPAFRAIDQVQTAWYHTHLMDSTTDQVIRGLAGLIIVQDTLNDPLYASLPHDYGVNDLPIVIQEKDFNVNRAVSPPVVTSMVAGEKPGPGRFTMINGAINAVYVVPKQITRLRILNGSPIKMFHIGLSNHRTNFANPISMHMIATGGGYIENTTAVDSTLMSVGDRREFLVDFSQYNNGDTIYMINLASSLPADVKYGTTLGTSFMAFVVDSTISAPAIAMPTSLVSYGIDPGPISKTRQKQLLGQGGGGNGQGQTWTIDGQPMDMMRIDDTVLVNTKERWVIENTTNKAHPFHIHKVQFQVTKYEGVLGTNDTAGIYEHPNLPPELIGYKDVQLIRAGAILTFEASFDSFPNAPVANMGYMYHCHILTHEDNSMMHQFVVVDSADYNFGATALPEKAIQRGFSLYPNPAENSLTFSNEQNQDGVLRLYDAFGKLLMEKMITGKDTTNFSVADLPRGMIVVIFTTDQKQMTRRVILK